MSEETLFHESWYRIAHQRIALKPNVKVQRQIFRGQRWYVLRDPFSHQFYRLRPSAYQFVSRLGTGRTVEEVWKQAMDLDPQGAPGQGEVIELMAQLYHANLLHYSLAPDSVKLFERFKKKKQRILKANLLNIMFFRIPLIDPDSFLRRIAPVLRRILSPVGAVVWAAVVLAGLKVAMDHAGELRVQSQGILAPSNLFLLYVGAVIIKALHEFGHAVVVRRYGGEVHVMGVMFLIFSPLPYMDASAAWAFREKWRRVFVGGAGMIFEMFVAAIGMFVWANTSPGAVHSIAYNMIFVASVSTLLFNINPLLRYDGYYMLSDLIGMPNLHQQASDHMTYLVERHAFGRKEAETPAATRKEAVWLTTFGVLSGIYRVLVFSGILLFVADRFLLLGLLMAVVCAVAWVATPLVRLVRYLSSNPGLHRVRPRAVAVTGGAFAFALAFLALLPFPHHFKAPGVLKAVDYVVAVNGVPGRVEEILAPSGAKVKPGDPLLRLANPELDMEIREARAGLDESRARFQKAMQQQQADMGPLSSRMEYFEKRLERLEGEKADLLVTSDVGGIWISPHLNDFRGMWIPRGTPMGQLVNDEKFYFVSVVSQEDVSELFARGVRQMEVKLSGQAETAIPVQSYESIPMEQTHLPSPALGWGAGGDVAVDTKDDRGVKTAEPFYEVRAVLEGGTEASLLHGRSGKIRFRLAAEPLLWQGWRGLRQLVQKRYQV